MKNCEIPKTVSYKTLTSFIQSIDAGEMIDLETLAARFNVEAFPGVYRPLKPFLLQLADLYLFLDERVPCLHWFNGKKNVLYIAIGADGAPFGRNDTATGDLCILLIKHRAMIIYLLCLIITRITVADPDLQVRGGGGGGEAWSSRPLEKGGAACEV